MECPLTPLMSTATGRTVCLNPCSNGMSSDWLLGLALLALLMSKSLL